MKEQILLSLVAVSAITIIESIALLKGINGSVLMLSFALIGGIAGYEIKSFQNKEF